MVELRESGDAHHMDTETGTMHTEQTETGAPTMKWWEVPVARDIDAGRVSGVVAGVSRAWGFDRKTTRIAVAIATLVLPVFALIYVVAWVLLPQHLEDAVPLRAVVTDRRRLPLMIAIGIVLIAGGAGSFGSWVWFGGVSWGAALIAVGLLLWVMPKMGSGSRASTPASTPVASWVNVPPSPTAPAPVNQARPPQLPKRRRRPIVAISLVVASAYILVTAIGASLNWWSPSVLWTSMTALIVLIMGLLVGALVNRSWIGIPVALLLMVVSTSLLVAHPNLNGGVGTRNVSPISATAAQVTQHLGMGELRLDLTRIAGDERTVTVNAEVGFGRLFVLVPRDVTLQINTTLGAGHAVLDGREIANGIRQQDERTIEPVRTSQRTLILDLRIGGGEIAIDTTAVTGP